MSPLMGMSPALEILSVPAHQLAFNPFIPRIAYNVEHSILSESLTPTVTRTIRPLMLARFFGVSSGASQVPGLSTKIYNASKDLTCESILKPTLFSLVASLVKQGAFPVSASATYDSITSHMNAYGIPKKNHHSMKSTMNKLGQSILTAVHSLTVPYATTKMVPAQSQGEIPASLATRARVFHVETEQEESLFDQHPGDGSLVIVKTVPVKNIEELQRCTPQSNTPVRLNLDVEYAAPIFTALKRSYKEGSGQRETFEEPRCVDISPLEGIAPLKIVETSYSQSDDLQEMLQQFELWSEKNKAEREKAINEIPGDSIQGNLTHRIQERATQASSIIPEREQALLIDFDCAAKKTANYVKRNSGRLLTVERIACCLTKKPQIIQWDNLSSDQQDLLYETGVVPA